MDRHQMFDAVVAQYSDGLITPRELLAELLVVFTGTPCDCLACIEFGLN
jgi:hypothetical protein